jgi:cellulose biosynthesis protein BcsQ
VAEAITTNYIDPDEHLITYFRKKLEIEGKADIFRNAGKKLPPEIDSQKKSSNVMKAEILKKYIFPAMANLDFFFGAIAEYPKFQEIFEDDIKDLLGIRRYDPGKTDYGYMLQSLLASILIVGNEEYDNKTYLEHRGLEFRLKLLHKLQQLIWLKYFPYIPKMFSDNPEVQKIIASDFNRIFGWTGLLAHPVRDEYVFSGGAKYRKKLTFGEYKHNTNFKDITKEEYKQRYKQELERRESGNQYYEQKLEEYNEELSRKRPRRTFRKKTAKEWIEQ